MNRRTSPTADAAGRRPYEMPSGVGTTACRVRLFVPLAVLRRRGGGEVLLRIDRFNN